jgi:secretion/DNA translocation related TadE-like protein
VPAGRNTAGARGGARNSRADQRGAAALLVLGFAGVLLVLALVIVSGARLLVAQRETAAAADLAALAGAGAAQRGEPACPAARTVAAANRGTLAGCRTDGEVVTVRVETEVRGAFGLGATVASRARAGPVETGDAGAG